MAGTRPGWRSGFPGDNEAVYCLISNSVTPLLALLWCVKTTRRREVLTEVKFTVLEALPAGWDDPDAFLNRSALYLLSDHGSQRHLEPAIARLEALQFPPDEKNVKHRMSSLAGELLYSRQWEVSPEQETRLRRYYIPYYENQ